LANQGTAIGNEFKDAYDPLHPTLLTVVSLNLKRKKEVKVGAQVWVARNGAGLNKWATFRKNASNPLS
jgi:hypothetical protein